MKYFSGGHRLTGLPADRFPDFLQVHFYGIFRRREDKQGVSEATLSAVARPNVSFVMSQAVIISGRVLCAGCNLRPGGRRTRIRRYLSPAEPGPPNPNTRRAHGDPTRSAQRPTGGAEGEKVTEDWHRPFLASERRAKAVNARACVRHDLQLTRKITPVCNASMSTTQGERLEAKTTRFRTVPNGGHGFCGFRADRPHETLAASPGGSALQGGKGKSLIRYLQRGKTCLAVVRVRQTPKWPAVPLGLSLQRSHTPAPADKKARLRPDKLGRCYPGHQRHQQSEAHCRHDDPHVHFVDVPLLPPMPCQMVNVAQRFVVSHAHPQSRACCGQKLLPGSRR